jgi:putative RNA 2'-phosphotransferase
MNPKKETKKHSKFLCYILGHKPDEFGLVPDPDGFVKTREFLKAVTEENGWKFFRKSNIDEILISEVTPPIEVVGNAIRAKNRGHLKERFFLGHPPKFLYTAIRRKAYPSTLEKGIHPMGRNHVILCSQTTMAEKIGKRIDNPPILLTVNTESAIRHGSIFFQVADNLFLSTVIAPGCFTGPALPREPRETVKKEAAKPKERDKTPGSFFLEAPSDGVEKERTKKQRRHKEIKWKEERKRMRRR